MRKDKQIRPKINLTMSTISLTKNREVLLPSQDDFCRGQEALNPL